MEQSMPGETPSERDRRVRGEEARMVQLEERVKAIHELMIDERRNRIVYEETLNKHQQQDEQKFSSIDSRMQGFQTQISTITDTLNRIEKSLVGDDGLSNRVKTLEDEGVGRSAVQRFLDSTWTRFLGGASFGLALAGLAHSLGVF
jgi:RimJ/RimL family protein N-acetyltransferase